MQNIIYDCIIIGGGPAGLTCSLYLSRFKRNVLLIENNKTRNYASHGIHGFPGYDGIKPGILISKARKEAEKYGVNFLRDTVLEVKKSKDFFQIFLNKKKIKSRKVMLAYGVRDSFPEISNFNKFYGRQIHHCPVCDGYETSGKKTGVLGVYE